MTREIGCSRCGSFKNENAFSPSMRKNGGYCRECVSEYNSKWQAKRNPRRTHPCLVGGCTRGTKYDTCGTHRSTCDRPPRTRPIGSDYTAVHNRLRRDRGPAKLLTCANCSSPASEWAYDGLDPDERVGPTSSGRLARYSTDLDHYRPLCRPCHCVESPKRRPAPIAPRVEFEPGVVEPLPLLPSKLGASRSGGRPRSGSRAVVSLRKPPEWTGVRRRCSVCRMVKDEGSFGWRSKERKYRASRCRYCDAGLSKEQYRKSPRPRRATRTVGDYRMHRDRAIVIYGGKCVWCGATNDLEFDHPDNDGTAHRKAEDTTAMLRRISKTGAPLPDWRLQLLCAPCHRGDGWTKRRSQGRAAS